MGRERGASVTEYALVIVGTAIVAGVAAALFGQALLEFLEDVTGRIFGP